MDSATSSYAARSAAERRIVQTILATVGHELRTPLTSIRGYIETLLAQECDATTARRFLQTARRETLRLGRLVDGMLQFSPLDLTADCAPGFCDAVEQIRITVEMLSPMAQARRVRIVVELPRAAPVRIDADACVRAVANLLENALKYGRECGRVVVSCANDEHVVAVAVEDDGCGVPPDVRDSIFAMGVRADGTRCGGNGIGLAVVRAIARRAGGEVFVEASPLGGARFVLRLPAG